MIFNHIKIQLALLLAGFLAFALAGGYGLWFSHAKLLAVGSLIIAFILALGIYQLIRRQQKDFEAFLTALQYQDFSQRLSPNVAISPQYRKIANDILLRLQAFKSKHNEEKILLESLFEHIQTGVLLVDESGITRLFNRAAIGLLATNRSHSIEQLLSEHSVLINAKQQPCQENGLDVHFHLLSINNENYQLWVLNNISDAIAETEVTAWQKLIRVLVHEISNSVAPIHSLADTLLTLTKEDVAPNISGEHKVDIVEDLTDSINVIRKRSDGLMGFIDQYRKLTQIPKIQSQSLNIGELFSHIQALLRVQILDEGIKVKVNINPVDSFVIADKKLIEQVMINLCLNSIYALAATNNQSKILELNSYINHYGKTVIEVIDNGSGISPNAIEQVFVPFFTTKAKGSGIGLALCKQIILQHKGAIQVESEEGLGAKFRLVL